MKTYEVKVVVPKTTPMELIVRVEAEDETRALEQALENIENLPKRSKLPQGNSVYHYDTAKVTSCELLKLDEEGFILMGTTKAPYLGLQTLKRGEELDYISKIALIPNQSLKSALNSGIFKDFKILNTDEENLSSASLNLDYLVLQYRDGLRVILLYTHPDEWDIRVTEIQPEGDNKNYTWIKFNELLNKKYHEFLLKNWR